MRRAGCLGLLVAACALALPSWPRLARAQEAASESEGEVVSLDALDALVDESPPMRAARAYAEAARGDVTAAGTPQNPVFSYDVFGLLWGEETNGGSQHQMTIFQTFPWPGQLDARVRAAQARLAADRSMVELARAYVRLDVRRAYVALLAAQEREALLARQEDAMARVVELIAGRVAAGAGRRWDTVRAGAELAALRAARDAAHADARSAAGRLATLVGRPGWIPRAAGTLADLGSLLPSGPAEPSDAHPRLETSRREREAADAAVTRERALVVPFFELRLGHVFTTWPEGASLYGSVSMPIPLFDQNQGAIERAESEAAGAREAAEATRAELEAAALAARQTLAARVEALENFDAGVTRALPTIGEMAEVAYGGGQIDVFELLDAVRATRELTLGRVEREEALRLAEIDLLEATAGMPPSRR